MPAQKTICFGHCSTHDPDTTKEIQFYPICCFFPVFLLLKKTIILSDLKGVIYRSCRFCISKPNWCVPVRELIFKNDILQVSSCTYVCPAKEIAFLYP